MSTLEDQRSAASASPATRSCTAWISRSRSGEVHALDGPERFREVDALARADGPRRLRGDRRIDHDRRRRAASACPRGSARSAGCSSRCSIRWRCPAFRSRRWSAASMRARGDRRRPACTTRWSAEATALGVRAELLARGVNDEFSGGEQKRAETVQLAVLQPKFAILDEIDSGLDVDSLRDVSRRVERMTQESNLGVLAITHYVRVLTELRPDRVHVMLDGRIVALGRTASSPTSSKRRLRRHRRRARVTACVALRVAGRRLRLRWSASSSAAVVVLGARASRRGASAWWSWSCGFLPGFVVRRLRYRRRGGRARRRVRTDVAVAGLLRRADDEHRLALGDEVGEVVGDVHRDAGATVRRRVRRHRLRGRAPRSRR